MHAAPIRELLVRREKTASVTLIVCHFSCLAHVIERCCIKNNVFVWEWKRENEKKDITVEVQGSAATAPPPDRGCGLDSLSVGVLEPTALCDVKGL